MSKGKLVYLLYQKDFTECGGDRYFIYDEGKFSEITSTDVILLDCFVVTHDFWLISNSLYKKHETLPPQIIDVVLLSKILTGVKHVDGDVQPWDISKTIKLLYKKSDDFDLYVDMYYRRVTLNFDVYMLFAHKLAEYFEQLSNMAYDAGEITRFYALELPVFNVLTLAACKGIRVDKNIVRTHKDNLKLEYYRELKGFAEKHQVLYEVPNEGEIKEKLSKLKYNVQDYSLDFLIDFLPSIDGYTDDLRQLQKTGKSYRIFNSISYSSDRLRPIVESHWTSTSRIYHRSPNLQNISKKYRNIFIPDDGMKLCYVDFDQFEVGIMAALSEDPKMKDIYENKDAYIDFSTQVFGSAELRKKAKVLFLSYTYGMSLDNISRSVQEMNGNVKAAKDYFSAFNIFEGWKDGIYKEYKEKGRISTICANYLNRSSDKELSEKEKRSAVNHVIQGSATYIFKKALLSLSKTSGIEVLNPMHDAVLFQHTDQVDSNLAVTIFKNIMTETLSEKVTGKASIEDFYVE